MPIRTKSVTALVGFLALAFTALTPVPAAFGQDAPAPDASALDAPEAQAGQAVDPEAVVATIGGEAITEADLAFAAEDLTAELQQVPPDERRAFLVRVMIDMKVMAQAAREAGMADTSLFRQRLDYLEDRALRRAYFAETIAGSVTPDAIQALYDEIFADFEAEPEIRARHILVETEQEAIALKAELDGGADFAELAAEHSIDPGGANGGDLGFFGRGMMVAPFEEAAFALSEVGEVSDPVQSQFGWHLIRLEDQREASPPTIAQIAPQLQQQVLMDAFDASLADLMRGVEIDIPDEALAAAVAEQMQIEQQQDDADDAAPEADTGEQPAE